MLAWRGRVSRLLLEAWGIARSHVVPNLGTLWDRADVFCSVRSSLSGQVGPAALVAVHRVVCIRVRVGVA